MMESVFLFGNVVKNLFPVVRNQRAPFLLFKKSSSWRSDIPILVSGTNDQSKITSSPSHAHAHISLTSARKRYYACTFDGNSLKGGFHGNHKTCLPHDSYYLKVKGQTLCWS